MQIDPNIRKDDLGRFACPNERCSSYGKRKTGNIGVNGWSGRRKRFRQLRCHTCGKTFSENYGTPFYGIKADREKTIQTLKIVVERGSMRGAARVMGVDKDTVCAWVRKASEYAGALSEYTLHDLHMTPVELDELWAMSRKARAHRGRR